MRPLAVKYRGDIDGLRAIAVLPVVLYHLGGRWFSGGYVGVDVFFVISGYLITALVLADIDARRFTFGNFYMRRLRRLGPSLVVMLTVTLTAGIALLGPDHLMLLARATIDTVLSVSNILFWLQTGYFDEAAIYKPLIHTWSLGVEEQFYLVWPALLLLVSRSGGTRARAGVMLALALLSLAATEAMIGIDKAAAFYLTPFRVSEFGWGALIAITGRFARSPQAAHGASLLGLALIAAAVFGFDRSTRFPGLMAQIPAAGAALLIFAGPAGAMNRLLALPPLRYIGKISYSLYLAHWPIIVYYSYVRNPPTALRSTASLFALALLAAVALYHLVEVPTRRRLADGSFVVPNPQLRRRTLSAAIMVVAASALTLQQGGFPARGAAQLRGIREFVREQAALRRKAVRYTTCQVTANTPTGQWPGPGCLPRPLSKAVVVVGDSHAADLWAALSRAFPDRPIVEATGAGCDLGPASPSYPYCGWLASRLMEWLPAHRQQIDLVIFTERAIELMTRSLTGEGDGIDLPKLTAVVNQVKVLAASGLNVVFLGPRPELPRVMEVLVQRSTTLDELKQQLQAIDNARIRAVDAELAKQLSGSPVRYFSVLSALCRPAGCPYLTERGEPVIIDKSHWSLPGGDLALRRILAAYPDLRREIAGNAR